MPPPGWLPRPHCYAFAPESTLSSLLPFCEPPCRSTKRAFPSLLGIAQPTPPVLAAADMGWCLRQPASYRHVAAACDVNSSTLMGTSLGVHVHRYRKASAASDVQAALHEIIMILY